MKTGTYKFLGKPDRIFPNIVTGKEYRLTIHKQSNGVFGWLVGNTYPIAFIQGFSIWCPYRSWDTFYDNWEEVK